MGLVILGGGVNNGGIQPARSKGLPGSGGSSDSTTSLEGPNPPLLTPDLLGGRKVVTNCQTRLTHETSSESDDEVVEIPGFPRDIPRMLVPIKEPAPGEVCILSSILNF